MNWPVRLSGLQGAGCSAEEAAPEAAPEAGGEEGAEQKGGIDALTAFATPVVVFEVEPEGELVESQRRTDAVEHRRQARRRGRGAVSPGADLGQPGDPSASSNRIPQTR